MSARNRPHCRICGYTPRGSSYESADRLIDHIELKHPYGVLGMLTELSIVVAQENGDDSRCLFHGSGDEFGRMRL
jgi:hypothetical protein